MFNVIFPFIASLAVDLPIYCPEPISIAETGRFSQKQIASLLANSFFLTIHQDRQDLNEGTFKHIYKKPSNASRQASQVQKLHTIIHYFNRVRDGFENNYVSIQRLSCCKGSSHLDQLYEVESFTNVHVQSNGTIEYATGCLQVDFANKFIGGGVLFEGCVQEEIRFLICTELLVTCLVTPRLGKMIFTFLNESTNGRILADHEALLIIGAERFANYRGCTFHPSSSLNISKHLIRWKLLCICWKS